MVRASLSRNRCLCWAPDWLIGKHWREHLANVFPFAIFDYILWPQLSPSFAQRPRVASDLHTDLWVGPFNPCSFIYLFLHLCSPGFGVTIVTRRGRAEGEKMKMKGARTAVIRLSPLLALRIRLLLSVNPVSFTTTPSPPQPPCNHGCHESQSANESPFITHEAPPCRNSRGRKGTVRPVGAQIPLWIFLRSQMKTDERVTAQWFRFTGHSLSLSSTGGKTPGEATGHNC